VRRWDQPRWCRRSARHDPVNCERAQSKETLRGTQHHAPDSRPTTRRPPRYGRSFHKVSYSLRGYRFEPLNRHVDTRLPSAALGHDEAPAGTYLFAGSSVTRVVCAPKSFAGKPIVFAKLKFREAPVLLPIGNGLHGHEIYHSLLGMTEIRRLYSQQSPRTWQGAKPMRRPFLCPQIGTSLPCNLPGSH
jgi:hypothetical protein